MSISPPSSALDGRADSPLPVERLGSYRLVRRLGAGAMGTVFLAERDDRLVAVKIIHPHLVASRQFFQRIQREAAVGLKIRHPNVVATLDYDLRFRRDEAYFYLVMEYVEGTTLRDLLSREGPLDEAAVLEIARQAASGLCALHDGGIVHRDVKPENLIIAADERLCISDLGVARDSDQTEGLTEDGQFIGSIPYAAPECFQDEPTGPRSDLYSLGVVLYELVTGTNPFRRESAGATMRAHLVKDPPSLDRSDRPCSPFLSSIIHNLLAKDPADRIDSAGFLRQVLQEGTSSSWWKLTKSDLSPGPVPPLEFGVSRETALHGREKELEVLRTSLLDASRGQGSVLLFEGEPGIGKSRLVETFLNGHRGLPTHVLVGACRSHTPCDPIAEAIGRFFDGHDLEQSLSRHLDPGAALFGPFVEWVRAGTHETGSPTLGRHAVRRLLLDLLHSLSSEKPVLWILEDIHHAEEEVRSLLLTLAPALRDMKAMFVLTSRPRSTAGSAEAPTGPATFRRESLERLDRASIRLILAEALHGEAVSNRLIERIVGRSEGVPFFAIELAKSVRAGMLQVEADAPPDRSEDTVAGSTLPSSVRSQLQERLEGLSRRQRRIVDAASVQGVHFDPDLVAATIDEDRASILQVLTESSRVALFVRCDQDGFRFDQQLLQEHIYAETDPRQRAEDHSAIARALAADSPSATSPRSRAAIARHLLLGTEPAAAGPQLLHSLRELERCRKHQVLLSLADLALSREGVVEGEVRGEVHLLMAGARYAVGDLKASDRMLDLAEEVAASPPDPAFIARSRMLRGQLHLGRGELERARAALDLALAAVGDSGDEAVHRSILLLLAQTLAGLGDHAGALDSARATKNLAVASGDWCALAEAERILGIIHAGQCDRKASDRHFERARELASQIADSALEVNALACLAVSSCHRGLYDRAVPYLEDALSLSLRSGEAMAGLKVRTSLALAQLQRGRFAEVRDHLRYCAVDAKDLGGRPMRVRHLMARSFLADAEGRFVVALDHLLEAIRIADSAEAPLPEEAVHARLELARFYIRLGALDRAWSLLDQVESFDRTPEIDATNLDGHLNICRGRLYEAIGDPEKAGEEYARRLDVGRNQSDLHAVARLLVALARTVGPARPVKQVREWLEEAIRDATRAGTPAPLVQAALIEASLPGGDRDRAVDLTSRYRTNLGLLDRMTSLYGLWTATRQKRHLREAHELLQQIEVAFPEGLSFPAFCRLPTVHGIRHDFAELHA